ncbi:MAG: bifunctional adenosylcobinamide kinase/adenosylcobinamide-phosphate guanylyltransferase [Lachnospiraceae bacterium]|nr:bifunctional adenosylcobinamide kinase/adenosylcobinamide-phosphate guanylyltransferase [Lachnospiraceae bacterium]
MMILVSGGAASGKSEYAEALLLRLANGAGKTYLATMKRDGEEAERRILRHRQLREGKGFETLEAPVNIDAVAGACREAVLLECISNLTANEMFGEEVHTAAAERVAAEVDVLQKKAKLLVAVTNEVFSDGLSYDEMTVNYIRELAAVNRLLAKRADAVVEVVYGIPVWRKGAGIC